jgi:DNA-binding XRE family transcriptional regulator
VTKSQKRWARLVALRKASGLSQTEAAKALGLSRSAYSMYEIGHREPDFVTAQRIAALFGVNVGELLDEFGGETTPDRSGLESAKEWEQVIQLCKRLRLSPSQVTRALQNLAKISKVLQQDEKEGDR